MSDLTAQLKPLIETIWDSPESQLYEELGIRSLDIKKYPEKSSSLDPEVTFDSPMQGDLDYVLELGKKIFDQWAVEAYDLACGSDSEDKEDRKQLLDAAGVGEVAFASAMAGLLITQLAVPAALAPVIAAIIAKRFFKPAADKVFGEFCNYWKKNLPQVE
jgi:hypothetical protein